LCTGAIESGASALHLKMLLHAGSYKGMTHVPR
jgi:hypothetical protein